MGNRRELISETYKDSLVYRCKKHSKEFYTYAGQMKEAEPGGGVNCALRNGTGGILVIDVDGKNGGTVAALKRLFPDLPRTMTVLTASPNSYHLVYKIPSGFRIRNGLQLVQGVEIPSWAMVAGSVVRNDMGKLREYSLLDDHPAIEASEEMLAVIEAHKNEYISLDQTDELFSSELPQADDTGVEYLLQQFRDAPPGARNEVYLQVGLPVLRMLGPEQGELALLEAYPGEDEEWIELAIRSSIEKLEGNSGYGVSQKVVLHSERRDELLNALYMNALIGSWGSGKTGTLDRRIFTFIVEQAIALNDYAVEIATGTMAIRTGTQPHRARESVLRLMEAGRLIAPFPANTTHYALVCCTQVRNRSKGDNYIELSPIISNETMGLLSPSNPVWLSEGLDGRHSHVMAAVAFGESAGSAIAKRIGINRSTVSRILSQLHEVGLLADGEITPDAPSIAVKLAQERDGYERQNKIKQAVEDSLKRREDALTTRINEVIEKINRDDPRRQAEEELLWGQIL